MKLRLNFGPMILMLALAGLAGCARDFHSLDVQAPPPGAVTTLRSQSVLIRNVTDAREFFDKPVMPNTPSLAEENVDAAPSALKARAIGRVRDGFGKARGNVLLPEGRTAEALVRETLANVFTGLGYHIETDVGNLSGGDITVDVTIQDMWGWVEMSPGGAWGGSGAMYLDGKMAAKLDIAGPLGKKAERTMEAAARFRLGTGPTPGNWRKLYNLLLQEYAETARKALQDLPQP